MILPIGPWFGMSIQGHPEATNKTSQPLPTFRPPIPGYPNPSRFTSQLCLQVRLNSVGLLDVIPVPRPVGIDKSARLHGGGRAAQVCKFCVLTILVLNIVPLENNSSFELSASVSGGQVGVLLHDEPEDHANTDFPIIHTGFARLLARAIEAELHG